MFLVAIHPRTVESIPTNLLGTPQSLGNRVLLWALTDHLRMWRRKRNHPLGGHLWSVYQVI